MTKEQEDQLLDDPKPAQGYAPAVDNGLNNLPVSSIVETFGFGATSKTCIVLQRQRPNGTYLVGVRGDTANVQRIHPDDIVRVIHVEVDNEGTEANAELIARAPEMQSRIAELEAALGGLLAVTDAPDGLMYRGIPGEGGTVEDSPRNRIVLAVQAARAALAKKETK